MIWISLWVCRKAIRVIWHQDKSSSSLHLAPVLILYLCVALCVSIMFPFSQLHRKGVDKVFLQMLETG